MKYVKIKYKIYCNKWWKYMNIEIKVGPKEVKTGSFNYSNIKSLYGVNTQYFTKDGKPFTPIAGEMHFSRVPRARWKETLLKMRNCGINVVSISIRFSTPKRASAFLTPLGVMVRLSAAAFRNAFTKWQRKGVIILNI